VSTSVEKTRKIRGKYVHRRNQVRIAKEKVNTWKKKKNNITA
jgi:hypothetical protein